MMVIPNSGKLLLIQMALGNPGAITEDFVVDLYSNNYTPVDSSVASNFTTAAFTGYAQASVPRSSFGAPTIVSNVANITSSATPQFACSGGGGQTVYGWYMRGATSGTVYAAQIFSAPLAMVPGLTLSLYPFTFESDTFTS
jgi:hypothetical protein